jgi:hypothetical protein
MHTDTYVLCGVDIENTHSFFKYDWPCFKIKNTENSSGKYWQDLNMAVVGNFISSISGKNWRACT